MTSDLLSSSSFIALLERENIYLYPSLNQNNNDVLPLHDENIEDDIDQVEKIAENQLEGPVAVAPVVI
jgi:hypothetical protein